MELKYRNDIEDELWKVEFIQSVYVYKKEFGGDIGWYVTYDNFTNYPDGLVLEIIKKYYPKSHLMSDELGTKIIKIII